MASLNSELLGNSNRVLSLIDRMSIISKRTNPKFAVIADIRRAAEN